MVDLSCIRTTGLLAIERTFVRAGKGIIHSGRGMEKGEGESSMCHKCLFRGRSVNSADSMLGYHPKCTRLGDLEYQLFLKLFFFFHPFRGNLWRQTRQTGITSERDALTNRAYALFGRKRDETIEFDELHVWECKNISSTVSRRNEINGSRYSDIRFWILSIVLSMFLRLYSDNLANRVEHWPVEQVN